MTHQEKLTKVTEAIHKACPDLLEPVFGCWIKYQNSTELHRIVKFYPQDKHVFLEGLHETYPLELFTILGQPIGWIEVLRAIGKLWGIGGSYYLSQNKISLQIPELKDDTVIDKSLDWDLTKTLDQQEEPVISLLYSIFYQNA